MDGKYSLPAGHVDRGETFTQTIIRESSEEIGVRLDAKHIRVAHIMHRNSLPEESQERVDTFFIAEEWEGEPINKEPHKCDDLSWFSLSELPENLLPYVRQAIECSIYNIFYSEFGWK